MSVVGRCTSAVLLVATAADALTLSSRKMRNEQLPVWVHAYARSGSSTVLSMVSQAFSERARMPLGATSLVSGAGAVKPAPEKVFSLFEPCHKGDQLDPELASKGCPGLLLSLANCSFDRIRGLHGWSDSHSKTRGAGDYAPDRAGSACSGADVVAFKTISSAGEHFELEEQGLPVLNNDTRLKMVDIVRDPRAIYASWMSTFPFNDSRLEDGVKRDNSALTKICDSYASSIALNHSNVHRIVFEQLIRNPEGVMKDVYRFLRVPFGDAQRDWVHKTFNAKDCPGVNEFVAPYSDCHTNATASLEKWRGVLFADEKQAFSNHPACQTVADAYNYSLV